MLTLEPATFREFCMPSGSTLLRVVSALCCTNPWQLPSSLGRPRVWRFWSLRERGTRDFCTAPKGLPEGTAVSELGLVTLQLMHVNTVIIAPFRPSHLSLCCLFLPHAELPGWSCFRDWETKCANAHALCHSRLLGRRGIRDWDVVRLDMVDALLLVWSHVLGSSMSRRFRPRCWK